VTLARTAALVVAAWLCACGGEPLPSDLAPASDPAPDDPAAAVEACRADAESFVLRALPLVHGRQPLGSTEVRVLASLVDELDRRGRDGRRELAAALADGDAHRRRWSSELLDLLRVRRAGHRALGGCYGERGPAGDSDALARFVQGHPPTEPFPGGPWSMRDLVESSLRADDLRPLLRADLLVRMTAPVDDANTPPDALERARRTNLGRAFEATYLGRRFECLACHTDEASVTDHPDPALDRFWPVARGLERAVYPADEDAMHATFRWEGFADGELAPWGAEGCGGFSFERDHDPLPTAASLAGELPPGAHALDLQARLDEGLAHLVADGWSDAPADPAQALAQLVVLHLVDGLWAATNGVPLTLDHGAPRNAAQAERLRRLAIAFVRSGFSLRRVLVEIAVDPLVDQAVPADCELDGPEPLPPVFDPFTDSNGAGHRVHRRDPLALLDEAHRLLGRALPGLVDAEPGFEAETVGALGLYLEESRPGHDGLDLLGTLTWERTLEALPSAPAAELDAAAEPSVTLDELVLAAREDRSITVGELMIATKDRVLAEPVIDPDEQALVETLVGLSWSRPAHELDGAALHAAAWRYARVLLATPRFLLSGLEQGPVGPSPRLWPAHARVPALCAHWGPRVLPSERFVCTDHGLALP
jgi:hypothetical protein